MLLEPIQFGEPGDKPQIQLSQLVLQTRDLLDGLIQQPEYRKVFYPDPQMLKWEAWSSVSNRFEPYAANVRNAEVAVLGEHGLTEAELWFKLAAINFLANRFFTLFPGAPLSVGRRLVSKLLEVIDKVLKSLIDAVPGGGAITEYKDICESLISDDTVEL